MAKSWFDRRPSQAARAGRPLVVLLALVIASGPAPAAATEVAAAFQTTVEPVLTQYCAGCHNNKVKKGGVTFDVPEAQLLADRELWLKALKMLRAGMMPPRGKDRPTADEAEQVAKWIKYSAFGIDPHNPDPGRVTLRRLNRTEYRNTIRDLMGVDFDATAEFPADDTGHGFDNLGDVLTISPLLLEKYIAAAKTIVGQAVPTQPGVPAERRVAGRQFAPAGGRPSGPANNSLSLSYYKPGTVRHTFPVEHAGRYQLVLDLSAHETFVDGQFDRNRCRAVFRCGDKVLLSQEFSRQGGKPYRFEFEVDWPAGEQEFTLSVEPLTKELQVRSLTLRLNGVTVRGPMAREYWVRPANHGRFFPGTVPDDPGKRREYARKLLERFASRAYRRPVDAATVDRLVHLAEATAAKPGQTFEGGIAQAMVVVLASPRFLFREEGPVPGSTDRYPLIDEYALASRLSYFLWSSVPDEELFRLAAANQLRANLSAQVDRMLADRRSGEFVRNFAGQWLQSRSIESVNINEFAVLARERAPDPQADARRARFRELVRKDPDKLTDAELKELREIRSSFFRGRRRFGQQFRLTGDLRRALRQETELTFDYIVRNDRSLLELLDSNYTFLNERLARFYEIPGVTGEQMRKVALPANSPRGGLLTQGTVLMITSNPDRTSPVKRGLYILDTILGMPPPPPPPDVTPLEKAAARVKGRLPTLREALKIHREAALCASCHNRMDPLGLAFENFNALGRWRDKERDQPIEAGGELLTGEKFKDVRELKHILATERRLDFYRCATEKLLIYALGRGPEPGDQHTVDEIVARLEASQGRPSALIRGVIDSPAFQRTRRPTQ
jgi:hypothetical protein